MIKTGMLKRAGERLFNIRDIMVRSARKRQSATKATFVMICGVIGLKPPLPRVRARKCSCTDHGAGIAA
jgi:hypothetical protein